MSKSTRRYLIQQVDYHHDLDVYQPNQTTRKIQKNTLERLKSVPERFPLLGNNMKKRKSGMMYNKWYINPELHFKFQCINPKNDKRTLRNEQYIYKNLRNPQFWNWIHPFEVNKKGIQNNLLNVDKIDTRSLQRFKKYIQQSPDGKRLPAIVQHVLESKSNKKSREITQYN